MNIKNAEFKPFFRKKVKKENKKENVTKISGLFDSALDELRSIRRKSTVGIIGFAVLFFIVGTLFALFDIGCDVYYGEKYVGTVASHFVAQSALNDARIKAEKEGIVLNDEKLNVAIKFVDINKLSSKNDVADAIFLTAPNTTYAYECLVNGQRAFSVLSEEEARGAIADFLVSMSIGKNATLKDDVTVRKSAAATKNIVPINEASQKLREMNTQVMYYTDVTIQEIIPHGDTYEESDLYYRGEKAEKIDGTDGVANTVKRVFYDGDTIIDEAILSSEVVTEPIDGVMYIGTKERESIEKTGIKNPLSKIVINSHFGSRWGRKHKGLDLGGNLGDTVMASACGEVIYAGENGSYGNFIEIKHTDGYSTCYGHLNRVSVNVGDYVLWGDKIGEMGTTGRSTGVHLHFEIKKNGEQIDPEPFLVKQ